MFYQVNNKQTAETFKNAIHEGDILVLYYANWCGYCQQFKPEWELLKQKIEKDPLCHIGEVESAYMSHLPDVEITSYPTILFYKSGVTNNKRNTTKNNKTKKEITHLDSKKNNIPKKINSFQDLIDRMMNNKHMKQPTQQHDNIIPYENTRTVDNLLQFIRGNTNINNLSNKLSQIQNKNKTKKHNTITTTKSKKHNTITTTKSKKNRNSGKKVKKHNTTTKSKKSRNSGKITQIHNETSYKDYKEAKRNDKSVISSIMESYKED